MRKTLRSTAIMMSLLAAACGSSTLGPTDTSSGTEAKSATTASLIGPTWRLASIDGRNAVAGVSVTAVFSTDDRVAGSAGCNRYFGGAAATGARLDVGLMATTMMYCGAEGVMPQEQAYLSALEKAKVYRIDGAQLRLGPSAGVVSLVFDRAVER
ncbi:MAG TPA: META domain-containing protein [Vicinamibacteria bacterium]|nr:META domain-containing protein [Vicinamibacteria bacterium]